MGYKIIVSSIASRNIDDAIQYYSQKVSKKVALDFLKDYKKTFKAIQSNPFYQFHDKNYRFLPFSKFPYIAFFITDETNKKIYLNAIFHTSQNPNKNPIE